MSKFIKKLFGGIDLSWPKLIISAVMAGAVTAAIAIIPALKFTSLHAIAVTFEAWILIGIIIIMNSKSNLDSALKCFVFFLISQPIVYLIQVPFSELGWGMFVYYRYWFIWTVLCLPMGYIGYYMKKGNWLGYLILLPMIALTASSYMIYLSDLQFSAPRYILAVLFCAAMMMLYPLAIFDDKKIRRTGTAVSAAIIIGITVFCLLRPPVYNTIIMGSNEEHAFDSSYTVYLDDPKYGDVSIRSVGGLDGSYIEADFRRSGDTVLTIVSPSGEKTEFDLHIERDTFEVRNK